MSFKAQLFFDPDSIASIDTDFDSVASYLVGGDKALLDKENDTASAADDRGLGMLAVRKDSATALAGTDGDYSFLQVDSNGRLRVDAEVSVESGSDKVEDSAHASGDVGTYMLAVRADARPIDANTSADGDYASLFVNDSGELWVKDADSTALLTTIDADTSSIASDASSILADTTAILADTANIDTNVAAILVDTGEIQTAVEAINSDTTAILADTANIDTNVGSIDSTLTALSKAEDAAHSSGDQGIMSLAVRNDSGSALAGADGDYIPFTTDSSGALRVVDANSTSPVANVSLENKVVAMSTTAVQIDASPLSGRKKILIQNDGNQPVFIGKSDVTADSTAATGGFRLNKGSVLELDLGPAVAIYGRTASSTSSIRIVELS